MKSAYTFILLCFINFFSHSQTISGVIKDTNTNQPIESVTISMLETKEAVSSDNLGRYHIDIKNNKDKLLVSCLGYQSVLIDLNNFIDKKIYTVDLSLIPKVEELKEIVVTKTSNDNYIIKKLGLTKGIVVAWLVQSGHEVCTLVKTPYTEEQYIKTVILNVEKRFKKEFFLNHFKINFYEYDDNKKQPGAKINTEEIIVFPENKNYALAIDVNSYSIPFPTKGLCIGVEAINTYGIPYDMGPRDISSKEKLKNFKDQKIMPAPYLGFARSNNDLDIQTWERYIDKQLGWGKCPATVGGKFPDINLKINVEVKIKNNEK
jgi:hypothetical protein